MKHSYQLANGASVIRSDGVIIATLDDDLFPNTNADYLAYKTWCENGGVASPAAPLPVQEIVSALHRDLAAEYELRMLVISAPFPPSERESWPVQTQEARLIADAVQGANTAWIDAAATARGISREEMADRIVAKDDAYRTVHGTLTGVRQAIEDKINLAGEDVQALMAINIYEGWPSF